MNGENRKGCSSAVECQLPRDTLSKISHNGAITAILKVKYFMHGRGRERKTPNLVHSSSSSFIGSDEVGADYSHYWHGASVTVRQNATNKEAPSTRKWYLHLASAATGLGPAHGKR